MTMTTTVKDLLAEAAALTDEEIDELSGLIDEELMAGGGDPHHALRALRELGKGNTGKPPADLDPLDD